MDKQNIDSYLTFTLGDESFAVNVGSVIKILEITDTTKIPGTPDYMKGVINLRGSVLPVFDARKKLGFVESEYTKNTCIIVIEVDIEDQKELLGAIVDSVLKVIQVPENKILPPPAIGKKYKTDYITGVIKNKEDFIILIDINKVFSKEEIIELTNN